MNNTAFDILSKLNLPMPKRYDLAEALNMPPETSFYMRHVPELHYLNKVIDKEYFDNNYSSIEKMLLEGKLIYIEEAVPSTFGACLYVDKGLIYGEIVQGHIIGLLRRGMCSQRFYINQDNELLSMKTSQQFYFIQKYQEYTCKINLKPLDMTELIHKIVEEIISKLPKDINDLLLEILITNDRVICCDAKHPILNNFMGVIYKLFLDNGDYDLFIKKKRESRLVLVDEFDIDIYDNQIYKPQSIVLYNSALLSHYITRQWDFFETILVIRNPIVLFNIFEKLEVTYDD